MKLLSTIDFFGTSMSFRIFNNDKFHSSFSIISSFLLFVIVLLYSYFFGFDCYFQQNPKTLQSTISKKEYEYITLNHDIFFAAWRLED